MLSALQIAKYNTLLTIDLPNIDINALLLNK